MLLACCDINNQKAIDFALKFNIKYYFSIDEMLLNELLIDLVSVCTPNGLHAIHSLTALSFNKHVVCEKPMALNVVDCQMMIDLAIRNNRKLFMVMQNRFNPPVLELKNIIDNKLLGAISNVHLSCFWSRKDDYYTKSNWKGTKDLDGGILYTQFSHFLDILLWLFGEIRNVNATVGNFFHKALIDIEDSGIISLCFQNNILCTINYSVNAYEKNFEGSLTVIGQYGTIKIGGQYLNTIEYCKINNYLQPSIDSGNIENNYGEYTGSMSNHNLVYKNVMDVLLNDGDIATTGNEGMKTVKLIQNIYNSATWI